MQEGDISGPSAFIGGNKLHFFALEEGKIPGKGDVN